MPRTIVHNGTRLAFEDRGAGKPAFVFIHGWACDRSFFAPQTEHFSRQHRVLSLDLRGHGESDKPQGPYPIAAFADDVAYIVEKFGLGKTVAVGHSMGGLIVLQLAAAYPDCVAGIVLVDPPSLDPPPERRAMLEAVAAGIEAGDHESRRGFIENMFLPTSDRELVENVLAVMLAAPSHAAVNAIRGVLEFDGRAAAASCKVAALLLSSAPQRHPPQLVSEWLPTVVYGGTVGAGHFNQLEVADQVNSMIEAFLRHYI